MLSSKGLKEIVTAARPIIERQLDDAEQIAAFRDKVADAGGDWGALKALIKAQIQDERDETGEGKRVKKILDKAGFSTDYAELLGWSNMNEKNFSADEPYDRQTGELSPKLAHTIVTGMQTEIGCAALLVAVDAMIEIDEAEEQNTPETAEQEATVATQGEATVPTSTESETTGNVAGDDVRSDANTGGDNVDGGATRAGLEVPALNNGEGRQNALPDITFEAVPPSPMKRPAFASCFPEISGNAYNALAADILRDGVQEPIVRMGDQIIDGWARYNIARSIGIEYPVIAYRGNDVLMDVIRLQRSARDFTPIQERRIAEQLAKEIPHRAEAIFTAFQIALEHA